VIELPSGKVIDDYYYINGFNFAIIYPLTEDGLVILEKSYKHGPQDIIFSLPAGHLNDNEIPLDTAKRELLEETGYSGGTWTPLGKYVINGNQHGGCSHMFIAEKVRKTAEADSGDLEEIEIVYKTPGEVLELLEAGKIPVISSAALVAMASLRLGLK
jgi:ADP-ribose pyrophosphatase